MKKLLIFLGLTAFMLITIFALGSCNSSKPQPNNPSLPVEPQYVTGSLTMPANATAHFYDNNTELDFDKMIVGNTYTFDIEVDEGYKLEFVRFNQQDITVPYTFTAPPECHFEFVTVEDTGLTINPSQPSVVGQNVSVIAYGSDCELQIDVLNCTEHSPCIDKDCESCVFVNTATATLTASEKKQLYLPVGNTDDLYSVNLEIIPPDDYFVDYYRLCDLYGETLMETKELPLLSADDNIARIEIYLKQI